MTNHDDEAAWDAYDMARAELVARLATLERRTIAPAPRRPSCAVWTLVALFAIGIGAGIVIGLVAL